MSSKQRILHSSIVVLPETATDKVESRGGLHNILEEEMATCLKILCLVTWMVWVK
jgi:hypothetical protein